MRFIDLSLRNMREEWLLGPRLFPAAMIRLQEYLKEEAVDQVLVIDKQGHLVYNSQPNWQPADLSDQAYFRVHQQSTTDELYISEPVLGHIVKNWTIRFTRPIYDHRRQFAGVIVFAVPPPAWEQIYKDIQLDERGVITLVRSDGRILARSEDFTKTESLGEFPGLSAADAPTGEFRRVSEVDGVDRFYQYRKIARYPFVLYVGQAVDTVLAPYYAQRTTYLATGALATALLSALMLLLIFRVTERAVSHKALEESRARLATMAAAQMQRDVLVREVHHRIKNNLQGVIGLMRQHVASHPELEDLVERMVSQIKAVALVHGIGGATIRDEIGLRKLITDISQATEALARIEVVADDAGRAAVPIRLAGGESVPIALLLNELVFNAIKHRVIDAEDAGVWIKIGDHDRPVRVRIGNRGVLAAADFDFPNGIGLGNGLSLVKALLPHEGARLDIMQTGDEVVAELTLFPPVIIYPTDESSLY